MFNGRDSNTSSYWSVPAHITGIFQIVDNKELIRKGSLGAGFSIDNPVITRVECNFDAIPKTEVFFNNEKIDRKVCLEVAKNFQKFWKRKRLVIQHYSNLPIKGGFGTSGAGALGTAFALNELFKAGMTDIEIGQIAHKAEIVCGTGLGDVIAQSAGGAEIRIQPGAPGIGIIKQIDWPLEKKILSAFLGTMSTKAIINSPAHITQINNSSNPLLEKLRINAKVDEFLEASYQFASKIGFMSEKIKKLIEKLRSMGYAASMIMIGESVFVVGNFNELKEVAKFIKEEHPDAKIWIDKIATKGPSVATNCTDVYQFLKGEREW